MTTSAQTTALLHACSELGASTPPTPELAALTRAYIEEATGPSQGEDPVPTSLLEALHELPPHGAAWLAVALGSAVEKGLDPACAGARLVAVFRDWLARTSGGREPEIMAALPTLCQALVAHLARLDPLRAELSRDTKLAQELEVREPESYAITWIREVIARRSGDLFVVYGETQRVLRLRFQNVHRCYHLFSLIQSVLGSALPGGSVPNTEIASRARGQSDEPVTDEAWWHYQRSGAKPSMNQAVWGEESVETLQRTDGNYAVVLWTPIMGSRKWNSGFFGPTLDAARPDMRFLEELKGDAAAPWLGAE